MEESYARGRSPTQIMDHEQNNKELKLENITLNEIWLSLNTDSER